MEIYWKLNLLMKRALFEIINPCREGNIIRQHHECLTAASQQLKAKLEVFYLPSVNVRSPAGSNQVEPAEYRIQNR